MQHALVLGAGLAIALVSRAAIAEDTIDAGRATTGDIERSPWHLRADLGTDAPASLDARGTLEMPGRLRLVVASGVLPAAYSRFVNGIISQTGAYDLARGQIVAQALSGSLVSRAHLGWRPFAGQGLYGDAGYALILMGQSGSSAPVIATFAGRILPGNIDPGWYDISAAAHMLDFELGWEWTVPPGIYFRAGIGAEIAFAANVRLDPHSPVADSLTRPIANEAAARLQHLLIAYGHIPMLTCGLGYEFF
jgi:hypothetical protein